MNFIILSEKTWNRNLLDFLSEKFPEDKWIFVDKKEDFTIEKVRELSPDKIFIPHWSYIIPDVIFEAYSCIVFHMTDLPFGRGGSPLQNLIVRGFTETKISALKVCKELDAGDVYLKKNLSLFGTAEEIFIRANKLIEAMIVDIIEYNLIPVPQIDEAVFFKRRKAADSLISEICDTESLFDFIRMLDAEGYPRAFMENKYFIFEFSRATLKADGTILSDVKIIRK